MSERWPNLDPRYYQVHQVGPDWADVTEGSAFAGGIWERSRYDWSAPGTVRIEVTASNAFAPGSFWRYEAHPDGTGSRIRVTIDRRPGTWRGGCWPYRWRCSGGGSSPATCAVR